MIEPLNPNAGKVEVREWLLSHYPEYVSLVERVDELEGRFDLLSDAFKTILESRNGGAPRQELSNGNKAERPWSPLGDGDKYWMPPVGVAVPIEKVPAEVLEAWHREKATTE